LPYVNDGLEKKAAFCDLVIKTVNSYFGQRSFSDVALKALNELP